MYKKEYYKQWRLKNKEKIKEYNRNHYQKNRKKRIEKSQKYYQKHKEEICYKHRKYKEKKLNTAEKIIKNGGRLDNAIIIKYLRRKNKNSYDKIYLCKCDCGNEFETSLQILNKRILEKRTLQCQECAKKTQKKLASIYGKKNIIKNSKKDMVENTKLGKLGRIAGFKNNKTTGYAGIRQHKNGYEARITINKKHIYLGRTKTLEEALKLRLNALEKYHVPIIERDNFSRKNNKIKKNYIN